jgi:hypothetical protein
MVGFVIVVAVAAVPVVATAQNNESSVDEPEVAPSGLERWHPEAFEVPANKPESGFKMEYSPAQSQPHPEESRPKRSRGARIAMGILIPVAIGGLAVGITAAVVVSNWE